MCKQANDRTYCAELGADASRWSRSAPLPRPAYRPINKQHLSRAFVFDSGPVSSKSASNV